MLNYFNKYIKESKTSNVNVPQSLGLDIEKILEFVRSKFDLDNYLPKFKKDRLLNRVWIINLRKSFT